MTQQLCPLPVPGPDLDECRVRSLCQHACRNTEGSYRCLCPAGYRLLPSGKNCQGEPGPGRAGGRGCPFPRPPRPGWEQGERPRAGSELSPAGPGPALRGVPGHLAPPLCAGGRSHVRLQPPGWAHLADAGRAGAVVPLPPLLTRAGRESGLPCLSVPPLAVTGLGECPETRGHPLRETGSGRSAHAWGPLSQG